LYTEWEAAIAAGATLTEILQWERGEVFPVWFKERVVAWFETHGLVEAHMTDAAQRAAERRSKRKG